VDDLRDLAQTYDTQRKPTQTGIPSPECKTFCDVVGAA
jgi:hypothetical protein